MWMRVFIFFTWTKKELSYQSHLINLGYIGIDVIVILFLEGAPISRPGWGWWRLWTYLQSDAEKKLNDLSSKKKKSYEPEIKEQYELKSRCFFWKKKPAENIF